MTQSPTMALMEYLRKIGMADDGDFLREAVRVLTQALIAPLSRRTRSRAHEADHLWLHILNGGWHSIIWCVLIRRWKYVSEVRVSIATAPRQWQQD